MGNDLISRQAAIEAMKEKVFHNLTDEFYGVMQVLDELSAADVRENVKGKWVYEDEYYQDDGTHVVVGYPHCSVCNYEPYYPDDERIDECTPFCPNCGAKMQIAKQIVHDAIDNTPMAEDVFVGIKEKMHKAVDEFNREEES